MPSLTKDNWMVAWNRILKGQGFSPPGAWTKPGDVEVGPWPDRAGWSDRYLSTAGCCFADRQDMTPDQKIGQIFIDFHTLVVGDGIDPQAAHREFLKIKDYRERISADIPAPKTSACETRARVVG
jgi:hypothetical protein